MSAIVKALDQVAAKAKKIAAHRLEAAEGDIVIENGELKVAGTDRKKTFTEVALAAYTGHNLPAGMEPGLKEGAFYDPTNFTPADDICEVEVDPDTQARPRSSNHRLDIRQHHQSSDHRGPIHGGITTASARRCSTAAYD
jgi:carbon-monoxide dehydrogenase large subunit